jgi:hypothetical protein
VALLRQMGIRVLRNERVTIGQGADSFELAGVEDPAGRAVGRTPDLDAALSGVDPEREVVLLAHRPSEIANAARRGVGLQLSGHTHGGQFWPFTWLAQLVFPRVAGLSRHGRTQLYVNSGIGYVGPPVRFGSPPEVTLVTLTRELAS